MPTSRNGALDALRVFSLLGVVTLHVAGGGFADAKPLGFVLDELSRFAVPVFFILSGWFWKPDATATPLRFAGALAWRILPAFLLWLALYAIRDFVSYPAHLADLDGWRLVEWLWTGGPGFHLWFLPALVVGSLLVLVGLRWLGTPLTAMLALVLFVIGCVMGAYTDLVPELRFSLKWYRNGILFAPAFLVIGVLMHRHAADLLRIPLSVLLGVLVVPGIAQLAEGYLIVGHYPMGHDYSLATLFYAPAIVAVFQRLQFDSPLWSELGAATFMAYLVHLMLLGWLVSDLGLGDNSLLVIALCFGLSLALALLWRSASTVVAGGWRGEAAADPAR